MYQNENFREVGTIGDGNVTIKLPGVDLIHTYSGGTGYVNEAGTMAHLGLNLTDLRTEDNEAKGGMMTSMLGSQIKAQLKGVSPEVLREVIQSNPLQIFYSPRNGSRPLITMLGLNQTIDMENSKELVVATYEVAPAIPNVQAVFDYHSQVLSQIGAEPVADSAALEGVVLQLASKANALYDEALEKMQNSLF